MDFFIYKIGPSGKWNYFDRIDEDENGKFAAFSYEFRHAERFQTKARAINHINKIERLGEKDALQVGTTEAE